MGAWQNGFAYIGENSLAKDLKTFGFVSATIAINMIYKFSEEFGCSSAERLRIIEELPENVPFIRLGKGKATRRYYRKCATEHRAIRPNEFSLEFLPPSDVAIPTPSAIIKGTVMGPVVTPPESKANGSRLFFPLASNISAIANISI